MAVSGIGHNELGDEFVSNIGQISKWRCHVGIGYMGLEPRRNIRIKNIHLKEKTMGKSRKEEGKSPRGGKKAKAKLSSPHRRMSRG